MGKVITPKYRVETRTTTEHEEWGKERADYRASGYRAGMSDAMLGMDRLLNNEGFAFSHDHKSDDRLNGAKVYGHVRKGMIGLTPDDRWHSSHPGPDGEMRSGDDWRSLRHFLWHLDHDRPEDYKTPDEATLKKMEPYGPDWKMPTVDEWAKSRES